MTQQNADALTKAFAAADQGDPTPLLDLYDDTMTWAGFTFDGTQRSTPRRNSWRVSVCSPNSTPPRTKWSAAM